MRFLTVLILWLVALPAYAEEIGSVDTVWKLLGANHKIIVEVFDDPKVEGVSCFVSRAKTGGIKVEALAVSSAVPKPAGSADHWD